MAVLYRLSDNLLVLTNVTTMSGAGVYTLLAGTATVTVTLVNSAGAAISGETWPLTLTYTGIPGRFSVVLSDDLVITNGQTVTAQITIDNGPGQRGYFEVPMQVETRTL